MKLDRNQLKRDYTTIHLHIGGVHVSRKPVAIRTVLGSCIAVCLHDPISSVGGMNHYMLPVAVDDQHGGSRYGENAMKQLVESCIKAGANPMMLEAKVFGGANVMRMLHMDLNVPQANMRYAFKFLDENNIPVVARDVGGTTARELFMFTATGKVMMRHILPSELKHDPEWNKLEQAQRKELRLRDYTAA